MMQGLFRTGPELRLGDRYPNGFVLGLAFLTGLLILIFPFYTIVSGHNPPLSDVNHVPTRLQAAFLGAAWVILSHDVLIGACVLARQTLAGRMTYVFFMGLSFLILVMLIGQLSPQDPATLIWVGSAVFWAVAMDRLVAPVPLAAGRIDLTGGVAASSVIRAVWTVWPVVLTLMLIGAVLLTPAYFRPTFPFFAIIFLSTLFAPFPAKGGALGRAGLVRLLGYGLLLVAHLAL